MKFVHIADIHMDSPFVNLSDKENLGDLKRLEQRKKIKEVIEYIKENKIDMLFIAGDLYEQQYIKQTTIEYINNLFKEIPETQVYIAPGNHDPYLKNSYYSKYKWNENVKIFNSKIEKIEQNEVDIYGFGFEDFYCTECGIENLEIENPEKENILILHGTLDGANIEEKQYNSISTKMLEEKGFDYVALGHIHKTNFNKENKIIYPGSLVSLGFDELGQHGMIVGEIKNKKLNIEFIPIKASEFVEKRIDVTEIISKEELIEKIDSIEIQPNEYVKIILEGKRNFEINTYELYKLIQEQKIIKIKNKTKINYNLEEIENETTLKGLFAKEIKQKLDSKNLTNEQREILEKAIEIGFEALS